METKDSNNIQTVIADTRDDCVAQIKKLYGNQYRITNWKTVKKPGLAGLFGHNAVQATFVVDYGDPFSRYSTQIVRKQVQAPAEDFETAKKKILQENKPSSNPQFQIILDEMKSLRDDLKDVKRASQEEPETIVKIRDILEDNEFSPRFIRSIMDKIKKEFSLEELDDFDEVQNAVVDWIGESIRIAVPELKTRPHVIALVGPTGVGKTTTVAKLAATYANPASNGIVQRPMNVRMITIDIFRIAARQQIETYGEIMQIPVDTVDKLGDLEEKITRMDTNTDVILIDTIGYSPKDYESIGRMKKILEMRGTGSESFLTVMASTKASDLREIMKQYEIFGYESVIITKLDETDCIGNLLSVLDEKNKSVAFITTGQKVPRDIEKATVVKLLMHLKGFKINRDHIEEKFSVIDNDGDEDGRSSI
ncbi:MAG: flagellar biosynthesis protein FlhF [Treponemataceae bacterium]|nr:flagellar biosynthesis protein FlhF [Treponemataceae bacterium]